MRRRLKPYSAILMLVLMLTLSLISAQIAVSQDSTEIISALEELQDDVSRLPDNAFENIDAAKGQKTALINKIEAVIHQIEAGADEGAISKLESDLKNTIMAWLNDDYAAPLVKKIDEIISLIKGEIPPPEDTTPPNITSVLGISEIPNYDEDVTVIARVEDEESGVNLVILSYSTNAVDGTNVTMNLEDGLYIAEIPAQPYNTNVSYKVYAYDQADNSAVSDTYSYVVIDSYAPVISWVELSPVSPNYNDTVLVTASIREPEEASEVQLIFLSYSDGDTWTNITMMLKEETIYEGSIPELDYDTTVEYMIYASDNAENLAVSSTYSYIVGDEYPPTVRIDKPAQGSYVKGTVEIITFVSDDNLEKAELSINGTIVASWTSTGEHTYNWNTTTYIDGVYIFNLTADDEAGNPAEKTFSVTVDNTLPIAIIDAPADGAFLRGTVLIDITGEDVNLERMELKINDELVKTWTAGGSQICPWDTEVDGIDSTYAITLTVYDKAGNSDESSVKVIVDNTLPTIRIDEPVEGSNLAGVVDIKVFIQDDNLDKVGLTINGTTVGSWTLSGEHVFNWDTTTYAEGIYFIKLNALDKAGNIGEKTIKVIVTVTVDNTSPIIEAAAWTPKEPSTDEQVYVTVKVSDPHLPSSGLQNVTLWYRNTTKDDWQPISMNLNVTSGNWTATIPAQPMETTIEFYIEAFDNAGNKAVSDKIHEYKVITPPSIPLAWIAAIILLILAAITVAIYLWRKRRREKQGISSRA